MTLQTNFTYIRLIILFDISFHIICFVFSSVFAIRGIIETSWVSLFFKVIILVLFPMYQILYNFRVLFNIVWWLSHSSNRNARLLCVRNRQDSWLCNCLSDHKCIYYIHTIVTTSTNITEMHHLHFR